MRGQDPRSEDQYHFGGSLVDHKHSRPVGVSAILCADWGKDASKRAVYVADTSEEDQSSQLPVSGIAGGIGRFPNSRDTFQLPSASFLRITR
jgi:hypothetical protein